MEKFETFGRKTRKKQAFWAKKTGIKLFLLVYQQKHVYLCRFYLNLHSQNFEVLHPEIFETILS